MTMLLDFFFFAFLVVIVAVHFCPFRSLTYQKMCRCKCRTTAACDWASSIQHSVGRSDSSRHTRRWKIKPMQPHRKSQMWRTTDTHTANTHTRIQSAWRQRSPNTIKCNEWRKQNCDLCGGKRAIIKFDLRTKRSEFYDSRKYFPYFFFFHFVSFVRSLVISAIAVLHCILHTLFFFFF